MTENQYNMKGLVMQPYEIIKYKNHDIEVYQDEFAESPRAWDNLGTMICFHSRYDLGNEHDYTVDEAKELVESNEYISLPLYLYDHSQISINTKGFGGWQHAAWDSGQIGWIVISKEKARKELGWKLITKQRIKKLEEYLNNEVEEYDKYLRGDVFGYKITKFDDSCWGYYDFDHMLSEAQAIIDWEVKKEFSEVMDIV